MVSKASEDLPEPDTPVKTTSTSRGISRSTFLRLCSRAPRTFTNPEGFPPPASGGEESSSLFIRTAPRLHHSAARDPAGRVPGRVSSSCEALFLQVLTRSGICLARDQWGSLY